MGHPLVALIAKPPVPRRVKTRFCPVLTPEAAAAIYRGFLIDTLALMSDLAGIARAIVVPPDTNEAALADLLPDDFWIRRQPVAGLTDALGGTLAEALARGYDRVVLLGSDTPSLPQRVLEQAIVALTHHDLVIGPATDGGYYLIGLKQAAPTLFEGMSWSTSTVFAHTIKRARRIGLGIACLSPWYDIDVVEDLRFLAAHLAADPTIRAPRTREALRAAGIGATAALALTEVMSTGFDRSRLGERHTA